MTYNNVSVTVTGPGASGYIVVDRNDTVIPSHVVPVPGMGDVLFHHASGVNVAHIVVDGAAPRISLMLALPGCDCGCQGRGRGLFLTPGPEEARRIAECLIKLADNFEAQAAQTAKDALARAAGKRGAA